MRRALGVLVSLFALASLPFTGGASAQPPTATAAPGPAAWYVTFHGGNPSDAGNENNVRAYDASGTPIATPVLVPGTSGLPLTLRELRSMAFGADGTFYVVNSYQGDSKILRFSASPESDGTRALLETFSSGVPTNPGNPGLDHPYGLAFDGAGDVLASSQDSLVVTRLNGADAPPPAVPGDPTATGSHWCPDPSTCTFLPGTLVPGDVVGPVPPPVSSDDGGLKAPRAIAYSPATNVLYVADSTDASVKAYDASTGAPQSPLKVVTSADGLAQPVGLTINNGMLYVTDESNDHVLALDVSSGGVVEVVKKTEGSVVLDHPAGIAFGTDGALYVVSRVGRQIERYVLDGTGTNVESASVFVDKADLPDEPEQILPVAAAGIGAPGPTTPTPTTPAPTAPGRNEATAPAVSATPATPRFTG